MTVHLFSSEASIFYSGFCYCSLKAALGLWLGVKKKVTVVAGQYR